MTKIVNTRGTGFPLIYGIPFTDYNADEEFIFQMNQYFHGLMKFDILSKKGNRNTRVDFLLRGSFIGKNFSNHVFYVYVFILYEGGSGRGHDDELRTQLGPHTVWIPDLANFKPATMFRNYSNIDLKNKECYCIGIYKQDATSHDVMFVGMPSEVLCKSENEIINPTSAFQTYGEYVREAYLHGIYLHPKRFNASSTFNLLIFRPNYFLWYMKHRDELHIEDIDNANHIIKSVQRNYKAHTKPSVIITKVKESFIATLRTKPFMLLAGISGTGKSRIVREFAFDSCPKELQDADGTAPGNYCMIEVKPNWHDSTELLGYWSNLNKQYMFTKFIKFLVKAKMYPSTPFFVCLDEMNLAPVEQYFAEFLSVLETRKHIENEEGEVCIKSGVLVDKEYFKKVGEVGNNSQGHAYPTCQTDRDIYMKLFDIVDKAEMEKVPANDAKTLTEVGLTLPENVFIVGTVNMDDTTHQFSRKVIDRAMTIEMNGGNLADIFSDKDELVYAEQPLTMDNLQAKYVSAKEVLTLCSTVKDNGDIRNYIKGNGKEGLSQRLEEINKVLNGTPFTVSYRVMNELTIYLAVLLDQAEEKGEEVTLDSFKGYVETAIDKILLMKILPRVEGDDEMFHISDKERNANELSDQAEDGHEFTKLDWLKQIAPQHNEDNQNEYMAVDKLSEMIERLNRQSFTRFWP